MALLPSQQPFVPAPLFLEVGVQGSGVFLRGQGAWRGEAVETQDWLGLQRGPQAQDQPDCGNAVNPGWEGALAWPGLRSAGPGEHQGAAGRAQGMGLSARGWRRSGGGA